jgi:hypothetical protein
MGKIRLYVLIILTAFVINAQAAVDTVTVLSKVKSVTVFETGAQILREGNINLTQGTHIISLDELPLDLNPNTIQIESLKNMQILSVKNMGRYSVEDLYSDSIKAYGKEIRAISDKILEIKHVREVYVTEEKVIMDNRKLGSDSEGVSVDELRAAADFYRSRLKDIKSNVFKIDRQIAELNSEKARISSLIDKLLAKEINSYNRVIVTVKCDSPLVGNLVIKYMSQFAFWLPEYDFRVKRVGEPLQMVYNAKVHQQTGEDWEDVQLTLSTGNPNLNPVCPELDKWVLGKKQTSNYKSIIARSSESKGSTSVKLILVDSESQEPIPFANIVLEKSGSVVYGTSTDFDGNAIMRSVEPGIYDLKATFVGYDTRIIPSVIIKRGFVNEFVIGLNSSMVQLDVVEILDYEFPLIDKEEPTIGETVSVDDYMSRGRSGNGGKRSGVNSRFEKTKGDIGQHAKITNLIDNEIDQVVSQIKYVIKEKYSIKSDNKEHMISIKQVDIPVEYEYRSVPKLDNGVFLTARVANWEALNLKEAHSTIYYQGTFVNSGILTFSGMDDTLSISLGRDQNIIVERKVNKEKSEQTILRNSVKENIAYDIEIRNNSTASITVVIEDQYPVSELKSMESELIRTDGAQVNSKTGILTWKLKIEGRGKKTVSTEYKVEYPKGYYLNLD